MPAGVDSAGGRGPGLSGVSSSGRVGAGGIRVRAWRAVHWVLVGSGVSHGLRLGGNVVLAWLLVPEIFGLMGLVNVAQRGLKMFSDFGFGPSVIRSRRGEERVFLQTTWTLQVIRGGLLWLGSLLVAVPMSWFYEPALIWLIPLSCLTALVAGFRSVNLMVRTRQLRLGMLTGIEVGSQALALGVMVVAAWFYPSVLVLVLGGLVSPLVRTVAGHLLVDGVDHRFRLEWSAARELLVFGGWVSLATALTFLATYTDRLMMAHLVGSLEFFGVFVIAYAMAEAPRSIFNELNSRVVLPAVASKRDEPVSVLNGTMVRHRGPLMVWVAALLALMVVVGDLLITTVYDWKYAHAGWIFTLLALGLWPRFLAMALTPPLLTLNRPQWSSAGNLVKLVFVATAVPLAYQGSGVVLAVALIGLAELPLYLTMLYGASRCGLRPGVQDMQLTVVFVVCLGVGWCVRWMVLGG